MFQQNQSELNHKESIFPNSYFLFASPSALISSASLVPYFIEFCYWVGQFSAGNLSKISRRISNWF